jgi:dephospho-CoA kinase
MSAWPGKYIIGLTGNIGTGKSVVRKMLEHLGAYGIDADALGHRAIAKGAPGYKPVIETFGNWILSSDGQIDRSRLARIVFNDPHALEQLEAIVHPLVGQAVDILISRSKQTVVVIEAIKLLESPLGENCDAIWVTYAPPELQIVRLVQKRGMTIEAARQRVRAQPPQREKIAVADKVIRNEGPFEDTWHQVNTAWQSRFPVEEPITVLKAPTRRGELGVEKARPRQAAEVAAFINRIRGGRQKLTSEDIMAAFGEKAFLFLKMEDRYVGLVGWQVENLVACTDEVYLESSIPVIDGMKTLMNEIESTSRDLQCEISLLFLPSHLSHRSDVWHKLGYEPRTIKSLGVRAWQEAASETIAEGETLFFKQLRKDRVLRPV